MSLVILGAPVAKPRMSQRDKWKKRPCVMKFFAWRDLVQYTLRNHRDMPTMRTLQVEFYLPFPKTYSKAKRAGLEGQSHEQKPDLDNLIKSLMDSMWLEDCRISHIDAAKYWTDEAGPRTVVYV